MEIVSLLEIELVKRCFWHTWQQEDVQPQQEDGQLRQEEGGGG